MGDGKKYTLYWTESSTSANIQYADDAAGLTETQRNELIKDHSHFAVVKWDADKQEPVVNYYLYRDNLNYKATDATGKTSSGELSVLTGADGDVMVLYDTVWWKVATSGSGTSREIRITFTWDSSLTDSTWVSPHTFGDSLSETELAAYVGLGVFEGYVTGSQLRSINTSSQPTASTTQNNFYNAAVYNRNWQYNQTLPMTWAWYIMQLYFVKGDRNTQNAYGNGIVGASALQPINTSWSATNAWNNGTTTNQTTGVTALGLQNGWGNVNKFMGESRYLNGNYRFSILCGKDHFNIESGYPLTWKSVNVSNYMYGTTISEIMGTPEYPFIPAVGNGTNFTQYYSDFSYQINPSGNQCVEIGGYYGDDFKAGASYIDAYYGVSSSTNYQGTRLHVLIKKPPAPVGIHIPVKVGTAWKDSVPRVKVNNAWKTVVGIWAKVNDTWKVVGQASPTPKKYTISWGSGSANSTSKNISWADDAAGMTEEQRNELIKDHCHFAVVKWDGSKPVVNYYLYRDNLNYKATDETCKVSSGVSSVLTGADGDVMLLYDKVWWKVTQTGTVGTNSTVTISFTFEQPTEDGWVSPHTYGDSLSSTSLAKYVGMGVFEGCMNTIGGASYLASLGIFANPLVSYTHESMYLLAKTNRNWQYNQTLPMTWAWYIIQLYFVKGNRNCQAEYGNGIVGASGVQPLNKDWAATSPWINGTTANQTTGVTALGIHNPWGNIRKFIGEMRYDAGEVKFSVLGGKDHMPISTGAQSTWKSLTTSYTTGSWVSITEISGSVAEYPFFPYTGVSSTDYTTYYADRFYSSPYSGRCVNVGGVFNFGLQSGILTTVSSDNTEISSNAIGSRLHVLITE